MLNNIVHERDGQLRVSSLDVAERTGVQHKNVLDLAAAYSKDLAEFGDLAFETRDRDGAPGPAQRVVHLNEPQAMLVIAFMRNSEIVRAFKVELVRQFQQMKQALAAPKSLEVRSLELLGELIAEVQRQQSEIAQLAPRADAWDDLASGTGTYAVGDAAKMLQQAGIKTGRDRLFDYLLEIGWLFRQSGRLQAMQTAVDAGRLVHKPQSHRHPETGETVLDSPQVRVTVKGLEQLRARMLPPVTDLVTT